MSNIKWNYEKLQEEALKYNTRGKFRKFNINAYCSAQRRGLLDKICSHMIILRHSWTYKELQEEALKYKTRGKFRKYNPSAAAAADNLNILDIICSHMPKDSKIGNHSHNYKWTYEKLQEEALKYKTRGKFAKGNSGAYGAAFNKKILDEICSHMPKDVKIEKSFYNRKWTNEKLQEEALKYQNRNDFRIGNPSFYRTALNRKILD